MYGVVLWDHWVRPNIHDFLRTDKMTLDQRFIRRKNAAIEFMQGLIGTGLSDEQALKATTDKFNLNPHIRYDYRIYKALWNLIGG